jgi:hypothetical protein
MKCAPQIGDTQAIFIEKPDSFIDWCIDVARSAVEKRLTEPAEAERALTVAITRKRNAA